MNTTFQNTNTTFQNTNTTSQNTNTTFQNTNTTSQNTNTTKPTTKHDSIYIDPFHNQMNNNTYFNKMSKLSNECSVNKEIKDVIPDKVYSFNYDTLFNTEDLTQKYSFLRSTYEYKPYLEDENEQLFEYMHTNNPAEIRKICGNLDKEVCPSVSPCVLVNNTYCVPGNKRGPYISYANFNTDYYYYKNKCYGNCKGH